MPQAIINNIFITKQPQGGSGAAAREVRVRNLGVLATSSAASHQ